MSSARITPALWAVQFIGVIAAAVAAVADIETILASGPLVCLSALPLGWTAFRASRPIGFYLALATPTMVVVCYVLISQAEWGPAEAQLPIATLAVIYATVHSSLVRWVMREAQTTPRPRKPINIRFSVRFLLGLTLVASVMLVFLRWGLHTGEALAIVIGYTAAFGWIVMQFHRGRTNTALAAIHDTVAYPLEGLPAAGPLGGLAQPGSEGGPAPAAHTTHQSPEALGSEIK